MDRLQRRMDAQYTLLGGDEEALAAAGFGAEPEMAGPGDMDANAGRAPTSGPRMAGGSNRDMAAPGGTMMGTGAAEAGPRQLGGLTDGAAGRAPGDAKPGTAMPTGDPEAGILGEVPLSALEGDDVSAYEQAYSYLRQGDFGRAEQAFAQFLDRYPDSSFAGEAQFWRGEALYVREQYRAAAEAFLTGVRQYPDSPRAPDSLLKLALSLEKLDQTDEACATLNRLEQQYPNAPGRVSQAAERAAGRAGCL
jgi:tol-pal system protein YbgF